MKRFYIRNSIICFILLFSNLLLSCTGKKTSLPNQPLSYNQVTRKICKADTTQSYEVYLPIRYSAQQKWPVIFAFDPHANATLAVEHLKEAAERFGYIVIGSNNSKNGAKNLDHILEILVNDAQKELSIDINRQYAAGFSGGGRVASFLATKSGNIKGIITCGAGLSGFNPQTALSKFDIYAIAGLEDFNYNEVIELPKLMDRTGWRYIAIGFDGGHEWPPVFLLTNAVVWFQFNAMKDDLIPKDEQLIEQEFDSIRARCELFLKEGRFIKAADECMTGINSFNGLHNSKKLKNKLGEIKELDGYKTEKQNELQTQYEELQLKKIFLGSFSTRDLAWWTDEIKKLSDQITNQQNPAAKQMYKRLKGFLGIVCYSYTDQTIKENNLDMAEKCIGIYEMVEPKNSDCQFYKAQMFEKKNKLREAAEALKKAIEYGMKDNEKIRATFSSKVIQMALQK